ncbi:histone H2A.Z-specific chaperone CHZ1-like [Chenopodium quinoa]|uniref:histone H2A.Z-specific chaperone CHZ1-like n=1 Tax=Chenopodium quinoa TaxID=63459 RepID=UPI000B7835DF|nr:histone H2A.Z-specific chaperone CHZ1-like [Chenopodium quinoa]
MADVNNCPEPTLPTKRIPDPTTDNSAIDVKRQKLETPDNNGKDTPESLEPTPENDVVHKGKSIVEQLDPEAKEVEEVKGSNGSKAEIDRKGKGILIEEDEEEDEDDSDDDSDDSGSDEFGDELSDGSDIAEDPLAEVDLDNILPSRTRRKIINPGAYLATDLPPEDSDDSDDPDA